LAAIARRLKKRVPQQGFQEAGVSDKPGANAPHGVMIWGPSLPNFKGISFEV
jgi:hypothetical protein